MTTNNQNEELDNLNMKIEKLKTQESNNTRDNDKRPTIAGEENNEKTTYQKENDKKSSDNLQRKRSIGHYILGKTIGEGTFGKVKVATHIQTGEKVAIQILQKSKILDVSDVERVSRQIHILKLLRHNAIIQLYEIIETPKQLFLIMEYASGGELFDYIVANTRVKQKEACKIFHQIISGIQYIHQLNIVHRDMKPENLLLTIDQSIQIVDFGLSNTYQQNELLKTACGSPCYAAPEMIAGQKYQGLNVDLWSCGVILYALVCGYLPFEDPNTSNLYKKILAGDFSLPQFISPQVQDLIKCILNTDPVKRFTIQDIRNHPWYSLYKGAPIPDGIIVGYNKIPVDPQIVKQLEPLGFSTQYSIKCIEANKHNHVTTTYYLLLQKHLENGGQSIADLASENFDRSLIQPNQRPIQTPGGGALLSSDILNQSKTTEDEIYERNQILMHLNKKRESRSGGKEKLNISKAGSTGGSGSKDQELGYNSSQNAASSSYKTSAIQTTSTLPNESNYDQNSIQTPLQTRENQSISFYTNNQGLPPQALFNPINNTNPKTPNQLPNLNNTLYYKKQLGNNTNQLNYSLNSNNENELYRTKFSPMNSNDVSTSVSPYKVALSHENRNQLMASSKYGGISSMNTSPRNDRFSINQRRIKIVQNYPDGYNTNDLRTQENSRKNSVNTSGSNSNNMAILNQNSFNRSRYVPMSSQNSPAATPNGQNFQPYNHVNNQIMNKIGYQTQTRHVSQSNHTDNDYSKQNYYYLAQRGQSTEPFNDSNQIVYTNNQFVSTPGNQSYNANNTLLLNSQQNNGYGLISFSRGNEMTPNLIKKQNYNPNISTNFNTNSNSNNFNFNNVMVGDNKRNISTANRDQQLNNSINNYNPISISPNNNSVSNQHNESINSTNYESFQRRKVV